jgi:hypothetical protein
VTAIGRPVDPVELVEGLGPVDALAVRNFVLEAILEREHGTRLPHGVAFWLDRDMLEVYAQDPIEAELGVGGFLLLEILVGTRLARCVVCGQHNPNAAPWCGKRCRLLLRADALRRHRDLLPVDAFERGLAWAVAERNTRIGWRLPLTREIAEKLYHRN